MTRASLETPQDSDKPAGAGVAWALRHGPSHVRLWIAAVGGVVADLWTKHWAFSQIGALESADGAKPSMPIIEGFLSLELSVNPGALFGLGAGFAPIFIGASVLALMFVLYLFANSAASQRSLHVALGLVLAGALGNLYDRATQEACVVRGTNPSGQVWTRRGVLVRDDADSITIADFGTTDRNVQRYEKASSASAGGWVVTDYGPQPVVRDFVKFEIKIGDRPLYPWIFNVADALLVAGVGILLLNFWFERRRAPSRAA